MQGEMGAGTYDAHRAEAYGLGAIFLFPFLMEL